MLFNSKCSVTYLGALYITGMVMVTMCKHLQVFYQQNFFDFFLFSVSLNVGLSHNGWKR